MNLVDIIKNNNIPIEFKTFPDGTESFVLPETINSEHNVFMIGYIEDSNLRFSCRTPNGTYSIIFENFKTSGEIYYPKFLEEYLKLKDAVEFYNNLSFTE